VSRRVPVFPTILMIGIALAVAGVAFASWHSKPGAPNARLGLASKQLHIAQTRANEALIRLPNAKPGQVARGSTRLTMSGSRGAVTVSATNLADTPGVNGGKLIAGKRLWIAVSCTRGPCPGTGVAYQGPLSGMGSRSLGVWPAGMSRTYTVRVWIRRTAGDNVVQGARARFGLLWTAVAL
jgi:hypothetical protein